MSDLSQRNTEILDAVQREPVKAVAARYGLSAAHVYRLKRTQDKALYGNGHVERFQQDGDAPARSNVRGVLFKEIGMSGLRRFGGEIDEDYDRAFKPLRKKLALYREMENDPMAAAVLQAIRMMIRRAQWTVEPGGTAAVDREAADWLETAMNDMSQSWTDCIDQALTMMRDGFSVCEIVYKRRAGLDAPTSSKYDDGKISWRKWLYLGSDSLAPGAPWTFDEQGGLQGVQQQPPPSYATRTIPIKKAILFRTTIDKNNPEGRSLLRAMYPPWYMKKNLEEIEGISAERMGAGFPVIYAGDDVGKNVDDPGSDASHLIDAVRNVRVDEQMGLFIPFKKMGSGLSDNNGVLFDLVSPPGRGVVDFNQTITRYETRMTMVGLAQFVHLGMNQVGARAVGESSQSFFTAALDGWLDSIEETIHRFGTERLFGLNLWPGLTDYPRIKHKSVQRVDLAVVSDYISKLTNVGVIVTDPDLEAVVREIADLPAKAIEVRAAGEPAGAAEEVDQNPPENPETASLETFAETRGGGPGRRTKEVTAVNAYQGELDTIYSDWSDKTARDLANASDDDERERIRAAALAALLVALRESGRKNLTEALLMALHGEAPTPEMIDALSKAIAENDAYLENSLIPDIGEKLRRALSDPDMLAALALGALAFRQALAGWLDTLNARVAMYAGEWWGLYNGTLGRVADKLGKGVTWHLDPNAKHCQDCPRFAGHYASFAEMLAKTGGKSPARGVQCRGNCRCWLTA